MMRQIYRGRGHRWETIVVITRNMLDAQIKEILQHVFWHNLVHAFAVRQKGWHEYHAGPYYQIDVTISRHGKRGGCCHLRARDGHIHGRGSCRTGLWLGLETPWGT